MLYLEIQRGKAEMQKWSVRYRELGATASCTVQAAMEMSNSGQREIDHRHTCILCDLWFASVKTAEAIHESGHEWIGIVKTSRSLFLKKELEDKMKKLARWNESYHGSYYIQGSKAACHRLQV